MPFSGGKRFESQCVRIVLALAMTAVAMAAFSGSAAASPPELLWQASKDLATGSGAGQLRDPRGIAASPLTGNVYVADRENRRISEFTPWGGFVKAWGWGVRDGVGEPQTCGPGATPPSSDCLKGSDGVGEGQIHNPHGIAVDPNSGDIYVAEAEECVSGLGCDFQNFRVQKFDPAGDFILMFGGEVNKTKTAEVGTSEAERNVCTAASSDECGIGTFGTGKGQFSNRNDLDFIEVGADGMVFVGDVGRIQEFGPDGAFEGEIVGPLAGEAVRALARDSAGNFYLTLSSTFQHSKDDIRKLGPTGTEVQTFSAIEPWSVAVDEQGNVYAVEIRSAAPGERARIVEFAPSGELLIPTEEEVEEKEAEEEEAKPVQWFAEVHSFTGELLGLATSSACDIAGADLYATSFYRFEGESYVTAYGPPPDPGTCPPPAVPPTILDQFATSVSPEGATLKARINPHFWPDVTFYVEYGTGECSKGGCPEKQPAGEAEFGKRVVDVPLPSPGVFLPNLTPQTTYHFRFVAKSGGGGPVVGVGETSEEGTFTTSAQPPPPANPDPCPNAGFRTGDAAFLPDCRAYEMVSPVDKNGGDVLTLVENLNHVASLNQSSLDGNRLTYSTYRAFGDAQSAPYTSQYLAGRDPGTGWSNHGISPPRGPSLLGNIGLESEYRAFSADLCKGWLLHDSDPPLVPGAVEQFANLYAADLCDEGSGSFEALTTTQPQCSQAKAYAPEPQGISGDLERVVFRVQDRLTNNAAPCPASEKDPRVFQCYISTGGKLRLLSFLPNGTASTLNCSVGSVIQAGVQRYSSVGNAISNDGSRVFWTQSSGGQGPGTIYLRVNPDQAQSKIEAGKCVEAAKACTVNVSGSASNSPALFWSAAADGSKAIFTVGDIGSGEADLYEATIEEVGGQLVPTANLIAGDVWGLLGMSEDAARIYLASGEALDGTASAGEPNLYLYEAGGGGPLDFIATLARSDAEREGDSATFVSPVNPNPNLHAARVSSDGLHAAFMSRGRLTSFNNTDAESGEADTEVFAFDATAAGGAGALLCVSCNPTEVHPTGRELVVNIRLSGIWAAAQIPTMESQLYASRVLSEDGSRLYFESYERLVLGDTNAKQDVYQWEAAGTGTCTEADPAYSPLNGGCVNLISSGDGDQDSEFVDAGADGRDVFFTTGWSLLQQDPGQIDIYDARVGGGFPPPPAPVPPCQGESCQPLAPSPHDPPPASATFFGPGDTSHKPRCPKGKHRVKKKGKSHCVSKAGKRRAHRQRGARR
jgi:hypothetical protein